MKTERIWLMLAVAMGCASCGGTQPASSPTSSSTLTDPAAAGNPAQLANSAQPGAVASANAGPRFEADVPPVGARFMLFCDAYRGPDHVLQSSQIKDQLGRSTGLHGWHILHTDTESLLYYGYYRTFNDREHDLPEVNRAQADAQRMASIKDSQGDRLFKTVVFVPVNAPDPVAPPQWDLARAPANAYWSLQIAAYMGSPERKQYAVDAVRGLRSQGVEAYFYHGDTISSVCIGAFPKEAIKAQDSAEGGTADPDAIPLVVNGTLPKLSSSEMHDAEGHRLVVQAPKLEVLDPGLADAIRKYPDHAINGEVHYKTLPNGQQFNDQSFLVLVPHADDTPEPVIKSDPDNTAVAGSKGAADRAAGAFLDDTPTLSPQRGVLKSFGN